MANKKTVHSLHDFLFFLLLLGFVAFIVVSELRFKVNKMFLPFNYWKQLIQTNDPTIKEYFYYVLNGNS
jgi:hypothetical protein